MFSLEQYRALREQAGVIDRSARGRLRLTGADRRTYLQGLLTNDIEALSPGTGCYAALLTAQGRMLADMDSLGGRLKWELRATWLGGVRILDQLDVVGYDVFRSRPTLRSRDVPALAWRALWWGRS